MRANRDRKRSRVLSHITIGLFLFVLAPALVPLPCLADDVGRVRELRDSKNILPLARILQGMEKKYPGTLLEVELEEEDGRLVYEMDILGHDQVVHHIEVNARSGMIISVDEDD